MKRIIVGLSGYAGTNKEAVAELLGANEVVGDFGFMSRQVVDLAERIAAADPAFVPGRRSKEDRELMWEVSRHLREAFGPQVLIRDALRRPLPPRLVVVGVRLEPEAALIRRHGGIVVRLTRPGVTAADVHESRLCRPDFEVDSTSILAAAREIRVLAEAS